MFPTLLMTTITGGRSEFAEAQTSPASDSYQELSRSPGFDHAGRQLWETVMKALLIAGVAAVLLSSGAGHAADKSAAKFLPKAIEGNLAEIEMGKLAQSNGQSDGVKSFGQMLVTDHSAANDKAIAAAKSMNVTVPSTPTKKQQAEHDKMSKLTGTKFDKAFAKEMVTDHKKDIEEYKSEAKESDAAGQYAKNSLPTLEKHLKTAQSLEKQ